MHSSKSGFEGDITSAPGMVLGGKKKSFKMTLKEKERNGLANSKVSALKHYHIKYLNGIFNHVDNFCVLVVTSIHFLLD